MTKRIILSIEGMECPNCAMKLETIEDRMTGVRLAEASYHKSQLLIEYDEALLSEAQLYDAVRLLGYQVNGQK